MSKYKLLNYICQKNQSITLFINHKVKVCILTLILYIGFYFIFKYGINNIITNGIKKFVINENYKVCDFSSPLYIIIIFALLLIIEIVSTFIMARRYVNDNIKSYK